MNVLVTGGAGYIGTELVKNLVDHPEVDRIVVYDNLSRGTYSFFLTGDLHKGDKVQFIKGELLDSRNLKKALEGIDVVYHLAAKVTTPFANTDAHNFEQVNHWGTAELIYALEELPVRKLIFASSASVYGSTSEEIDESVDPRPKTLYGISKLRAEEHVERLFDKMETVILRCGNVYGFSRSMRFDAVINRFAFDAHFSKRISIHGNGKQNRSFIHIDLIAKVMADLISVSVPSGTYNLSDKNLSVLDIVDVFKTSYPDLEFIFINQHLNLREMKLKASEKLSSFLKIADSKSLDEEIADFKKNFSF
jgi:UDP-glucose 4-epimerase